MDDYVRDTQRATQRKSMLDNGSLPIRQLAAIAQREGRRPVPIYHAHRWFARRFSSAFRSLLVASCLEADGDFWSAYYDGVDMTGKTVLDPFVGGGTSVVEATRMGANAVGVDIDPVACAITRFELGAHSVPSLNEVLSRLQKKVGHRLARYYVTRGPSKAQRVVLHAFWVQVVSCSGCGAQIEAHPHFQLASQPDGEMQWCFCRYCHSVHEMKKPQKSFTCRSCCRRTIVGDGTVHRGRLHCPRCSTSEPLVLVAARTEAKPDWNLFAVETISAVDSRRTIPLADRTFQRATEFDRSRFTAACNALNRRRSEEGWSFIPNRQIPREHRSDNRLIHYGYARYHELFNSRQLLHLSILGEEIGQLDESEREAMGLAYSDHLATNCMMTYYAFGWRRLAPLFSLRSYRHVCRPVEINPWLDGTGRGTFPNAVRQVQRAIDFAKSPEVANLDGGFVKSGDFRPRRNQSRDILEGDSRDLSSIPDVSVDLILTDPPYFDNIAYSELSDFYLPWLQSLKLICPSGDQSQLPQSLAAKSRGKQSLPAFTEGLASCFSEMRRVLRNGGRLVFSFQHRIPTAWSALACALGSAGWEPIQVFPMLGNSSAGLHQHDGTIAWDAVIVCKKGRARTRQVIALTDLNSARAHTTSWIRRLARMTETPFREADRTNLRRACIVAAWLGMFERESRDGNTRLATALEDA